MTMNSSLKEIAEQSQLEERIAVSVKKVFIVSVSFMLFISIIGLSGWIFDVDLMKSVIPGRIPLRPGLAVCFIVSSLSLLLLCFTKQDVYKKVLPFILSVLLVLVNLLVSGVWIFLKIEGKEALTTENLVPGILFSPATRPAYLGSVIFFFTGIIIMLMIPGRKKLTDAAHLLCFLISVVCFMIPTGYILDIPRISNLFGAPVSDIAGYGFCALCVAIFTSDRNSWFMQVFTSGGSGGILARRLVPWLLVFPVAVIWLRIHGERSGIFVTETGGFLVDVIYTSSMIALLWLAARSVNRIDLSRRKALVALKESNETMEQKVRERTAELEDLNKRLESEVIERSKAQEKLKSERERMNSLLELMPAYMILLTPDHHVRYSNRFFRERFGESNGRRCFEFLFERSEPCEICETFKVLEDNQVKTWEWTGPDKRTYSIHDFPYNDTDGSPMIMEMGIDVTELKRAESDLVAMNAGLESKIRERTSELSLANDRLQVLYSASAELLASEHPQKIINSLCSKVMEFLDCDVCFNYLTDESTGRLHLNTCAGIPEEKAREIEWLDYGEAVCGCVAQEGKRIIAEKIPETPDERTNLVRSLGVLAYACHPLISGAKVIGTLSFGTKTRRTLSEADLSLMQTIANQVSTALSRIKYEDALRESESRFRTIAESLPVQISISRMSDGVFLFTNNEYNKVFGYENGVLTEKLATDLYVDPEDRKKIINHITGGGSLQNHEVQVRRSDGTVFWLSSNIRQITFGGIQALLGASLDITSHKRALEELAKLNRTLNSLSMTSHAMMHSKNEQVYLNEVCRIITEECRYSMVWIGYAAEDKMRSVIPAAWSGFEDGYLETLDIRWDESELGNGPTGTAVRTGETRICRDMLTDPVFKPWRSEALKRGYRSSIAMPVRSEIKIYGALTIYSTEPDAFTPDEIHLLQEIANDLAFGISNLRLTESEKQALTTIRENEENYRLLFEGMTEGFALHEIITDENGKPCDYKFLSINPAFEKQTGLRSGKVVGRKLSEILPGTENSWIDIYGEVALTGQSIEFENYHSGLNKYFRVSSFSPKKRLFAAIFEDVTERVLAQKELQRTKIYLENLINYANAPIIVWNQKTEIVLFNHAFEHLTGYSSAEVEGKKLSILFPKESVKESDARIMQSLTENWRTIEIPILTKSREIRTVLWNSANIFDTDTGIIVSTIAQGNDITERIRAEKALKESKEKLEIAFENGQIGIWDWNIKTNSFLIDRRMERILGAEAGTFEGTYSAFERSIHEEDIPHFRNSVNQAMKKGIPLETIFRVKRANEQVNYISTKATFETGNGDGTRISGICFDITEMKKGAEKALFSLNEELLRSNRELEQFAYVASHDLQEPLRMVSSFTQLLSHRYGDKLDSDAHEFIQYAVDGAVRMQALINDLLDYSRISIRNKKYSIVDMHLVLGQVIKNLSLNIKEKNALVVNDELPTIAADEGQMVQLIQNLIGNSLKFSKNAPRIHILARELDDSYLFSVRDNGIGMDSRYLDKIFQIFQRLHPKEDYGGTGIGLAICKRIVEGHGGRIWVESRLGKGSTFYFTIAKKQTI